MLSERPSLLPETSGTPGRKWGRRMEKALGTLFKDPDSPEPEARDLKAFGCMTQIEPLSFPFQLLQVLFHLIPKICCDLEFWIAKTEHES